MLPIVATLLAQGLGLIGNAVIAKGKETIEEKLGVNIEELASSNEGLEKLRELEFSHEEFLLNTALENRKLDLETSKLEFADTANARDNNAKIQESPHASWLAKNSIYIIAFVVVIGGGWLAAVSDKGDVRMAAVSAITMVLGFFFGTTHNRMMEATARGDSK